MKTLDRKVKYMQKISRQKDVKMPPTILENVDFEKKAGLDNVVMIVHKHTSKDNDENFIISTTLRVREGVEL